MENIEIYEEIKKISLKLSFLERELYKKINKKECDFFDINDYIDKNINKWISDEFVLCCDLLKNIEFKDSYKPSGHKVNRAIEKYCHENDINVFLNKVKRINNKLYKAHFFKYKVL